MKTKLQSVVAAITILTITFSCAAPMQLDRETTNEPLEKNAKVIFVDLHQKFPNENVVSVGKVLTKEPLLTLNDLYNAIKPAKALGIKSGANLIKAIETKDGKYELELFEFGGEVEELTFEKKEIKRLDKDTLFKLINLEECSLATNHTIKRWCTELSVKSAVLKNYSCPTIADSSTFENAENYLLEFNVQPDLRVTELNVQGGSNKTVTKEILESIKRAKLKFVSSKRFSTAIPISVTIRAVELLPIPEGSHPQTPVEITEEQLKLINKGQYLKIVD